MPNAVYDSPEVIAAWREMRRSRIGSSDAPAIAGVSPFKTALACWVSKVYPELEPRATFRMMLGLAAEPIIARGYARDTQQALLPGEVIHHPERSWQLASLDYTRQSDGRIVEFKLVGDYASRDWGDERTEQIPAYCYIQVQHQLACQTTHEVADVCAQIGERRKRYTIRRNDKLIADLLELEEQFRECVRLRRQPDVDWELDTSRVISAAWRPESGAAIWSFDREAIVQEHSNLADQIDALETRRDRIRNELVIALAGNREASLPSGRKCIHYQVNPANGSPYFVFRVLEPKRGK